MDTKVIICNNKKTNTCNLVETLFDGFLPVIKNLLFSCVLRVFPMVDGEPCEVEKL